jgi:hypothetical protein
LNYKKIGVTGIPSGSSFVFALSYQALATALSRKIIQDFSKDTVSIFVANINPFSVFIYIKYVSAMCEQQ